MMLTERRTARLTLWLIALIGFAPRFLLASQIFKYEKAAPEKGFLIQTVPFEKWLERNYCGPACLAMVLNFWDGAGHFSQRGIAADIYDSENQATYNSELILYPRNKGFVSYSFRGNLRVLKDVVGRNIPVIVLTKTIRQISKGHYRVVIGFDEDRDQIIFHDPYFGGRQAMDSGDFLKVWSLGKGHNQFQWMMVVVPDPSAFPFPALQNDPLTRINLATAYYRRSEFAKSKELWGALRESLSSDPYPLYSLAMVSLREDKPEEAERYALAAVELDQKSAYAHDVLGLAYAKQDRYFEALRSLGQAVRLAPDEGFILNHYRQVRALYVERARLESVQRKENADGKTR